MAGGGQPARGASQGGQPGGPARPGVVAGGGVLHDNGNNDVDVTP